MTRKATISDIAKEAGVSKTTISRYINGNFGYMSEETRRRIAEIIKKHDYVPNSVARTLKSKHSNLIGVIVSSLRYQVGAQTVTQLNEVCRRNGYSTIVCCTEDDPEEEALAIQSCMNLQADGLVIIPCTTDLNRYLSICERGIPVVFCTRRMEGWPYGSVYVKHEEMIGTMARHLAEQGFEKVRFLVDVNNFHKKSMAEAFQDVAKDLFGMNPEESVAFVGREAEGIYRAMDQFLGEYSDKKRAVFAVNTHTLFLTLKYMEEHKISIPDEMGLCGYDAIGWSELIRPGISTIRQPMDRMGYTAGEKLIDCLKNQNLGGGLVALDGVITFRDSTRLKD